MTNNNEKFKWLKPFLLLFVFSLLSSTVFADNSTDYSDDDMETVLLIRPAPEFIPQCGANELYQSCEVSCINCEQRGMCEPQNCHISHCDCRMYFVHVTPGGPCEHVSLCPPRECPENEVYRHCGPLCESCDMGPCRSMECSSRCYCKAGYRRNRETGECIPEKECRERLNCMSNDVVAQSGPLSDYCLQTESEILRANETIEEEKCYCESGYKRNIHGWCIEEESCSFVTCFEQTEFQDCPRKCNTTCWNYGDANCEEDGQCYPGCFCREGYVLNEFFACIPLESCPPGSNPFVPPLPPPTVGPIPEPALEETSNSSATAMAESSSGTGSSSAAAAESRSDTGSSSAAAEISPGTGSGSAAAADSSSGTGSESAAAVESSSGTGSSSSAAESSSDTGSSSAAESSSGTGSSSSSAASSSGTGSSATAAESGSPKATESETGTESSPAVAESTEKSKETVPEEPPPEDKTTEAPKKPPKKATNVGKIYKSAARPGKTVSDSSAKDASASSKSSSASTDGEEKE